VLTVSVALTSLRCAVFTSQVRFTPSGWQVDPTITLDTNIAGQTGGATITFMPYNPLPPEATIVVEFPSTFVTVAPTVATSVQLTGLLSVTAAGHIVTITRDGT
jgi:hypothetical protein